jgi:hypothetical protein
LIEHARDEKKPWDQTGDSVNFELDLTVMQGHEQKETVLSIGNASRPLDEESKGTMVGLAWKH